MPTQLKRLANRCALAMGRTGTISHNGSGDIFLAFSTANSDGLVSAQRDCFDKPRTYEFLPTGPCLNPLFKAVIQATEEAVIDSILCQDENAPYTTPYVYSNEPAFIDESRATHPAWTFREKNKDRWFA